MGKKRKAPKPDAREDLSPKKRSSLEYSKTEFSNCPTIEEHERELVEGWRETATLCGMDEAQTAAYVNSKLRLHRRDERRDDLLISPIHDIAEIGLKVKLGGSVGAKSTNKARREIYAKEAAQYQEEVDALMADGLSYTKATEKVAISHNVCGRTVQNHTDNPNPQNRSRHSRG